MRDWILNAETMGSSLSPVTLRTTHVIAQLPEVRRRTTDSRKRRSGRRRGLEVLRPCSGSLRRFERLVLLSELDRCGSFEALERSEQEHRPCGRRRFSTHALVFPKADFTMCRILEHGVMDKKSWENWRARRGCASSTEGCAPTSGEQPA